MTQFLTFFIIIAASLFFSVIFRKLHLPWVTALIASGVLIGPHVLGIFEPTGTYEFLADIGLVFLMFMAGLETKLSTLKKIGGKVSKIALTNSIIPFLVGLVVAFAFGYEIKGALLLGIVFISSSVAVIVPILEGRGLITTSLGKTIVGTAVVQDIGSLVLLSILLQTTATTTSLPLPLFYILFVIAMIVLRLMYPRLKAMMSSLSEENDPFEREVRIVFFLLIGTVIVFELLGLHPIVAGFFAGLILSESLESRIFHEKLHSISYGLFIPIFFVVIGAQTDITVLWSTNGGLMLTAAVVFGSLLATYYSGFLGSIWAGFSKSESALIGGSMVPQLSTTLAASFAGLSLGIINDTLATSIVILSIVSTLVGTLLISYFTREMQLSFESAEK